MRPSCLLTTGVQATLERLLELLNGAARAQGVPVNRVEVRGFFDLEEDTNSVVVIQWVEAPPQIALAYWDHLGTAVEAWTAQLPSEEESVVAERIAIEVRWDTDAPAV